MRVVFMGTPDFAAASLEALLGGGHEVVGVFTKPDRPKGRGMKLVAPPVKEIAITHGIPYLQPETLKDTECFNQLAGWQPDLIVVVAYGLFLPERILSLPRLGCINVHGSLLPKYRGAAPIQWAIINGERQSGVCTMHMVKAMDAGDVILSESVDISENDTYGILYDKLKCLGAQLLLKTIPLLENGGAPRVPQDESSVSFAPPLGREDARIDWSKPALEIHNLIRGTQPVPCASSGKFRIHESRLTGRKHDAGVPGTIVTSDKQGLHVLCGNGELLCVTVLQAPGGPRMEAPAYARGHEIQPDMFIEV